MHPPYMQLIQKEANINKNYLLNIMCQKYVEYGGPLHSRHAIGTE